MSRKGYTLIELLVVVAIVGILSTMSMMKFGTYLDQKELDTEAYKIYSFISGCKVESYKTEVPYYFQLSDATTDGFVVFGVYESLTSTAIKEGYNVKYNHDMSIDNSPKVNAIYMEATSDDRFYIDPFSLGYILPDNELTIAIKHRDLPGIEYTITFYNEQARVRFARNGKDL